VNLLFAGLAGAGAVTLLRRQGARGRSRPDLPGVALVSASMFCLVYGFSNAATHNWHAPSTYGFLAAGATGFWIAAAIFGAGAVICGTLFRPGPLRAPAPPAADPAGAAAQQASKAPVMHV
jgi:hypothetical protein